MLMLGYRVKNQHEYTKKKKTNCKNGSQREPLEYISVKYFTNRCIGQAANKLKCRLRNPGSRLGWVIVLGF